MCSVTTYSSSSRGDGLLVGEIDLDDLLDPPGDVPAEDLRDLHHASLGTILARYPWAGSHLPMNERP